MSIATARRPAALFDLDGVLVQTEPLKARAHSIAAGVAAGTEIERLYYGRLGQSFEDIASAVICRAGLTSSIDEYRRMFDSAFLDLLEGSDVVGADGVEDLLLELDRRGYPRAVVTSSSRRLAQHVLDVAGIPPFRILVAAEDATSVKPHPAPYSRAIAETGVEPRLCLAFEDSVSGIAAAVAAKARVLAIRHQFNSEQDLSAADAVLTSIRDTDGILRFIEDGA